MTQKSQALILLKGVAKTTVKQHFRLRKNTIKRRFPPVDPLMQFTASCYRGFVVS